MRFKTKLFTILLIISMFSTCVLLLIHQKIPFPERNPTTIVKIKAAYIDIDGDVALGNNASSGYGNNTHPYIFENYTIDVGGLSKHGIYIRNTNAYFIVRNCTVLNADNTYAGIYLSNVENSKIMNNTFKNNDGGILLDSSSDNNEIINNTFIDNSDAGIFLVSSSQNNVTDNVVKDNPTYGILVYLSSLSNTIANNMVENSTYGIDIYWSSDHNVVHNNTFRDNSGVGIYIEGGCVNSTITDNRVYNNGDGIQLRSGSTLNSTVENNIVHDNTQYGIYLSYSASDIIIRNNTVYQNPYGIYLDGDMFGNEKNRLIDNTVYRNTVHGIYLQYSENSTITGNDVKDNADTGIYLSSSCYNTTITNNIVDNNTNGIKLEQTNECNVSANGVKNNNQYGIYLQNSDNNNVTWNVLFNNLQGIYEDSCTGNIIANNDAFSRVVLNTILPNPNTDGNINITWNDQGGASIYYVYRNSSLITQANESILLGSSTQMNYTDAISINGDYYYAITASNSTHNTSISNCESVAVVLPPPQINMQSPGNNSAMRTGELVQLDITDTDLDIAWYSLDGGPDVTLSSPYDINTSTWSEGSRDLIVYANDSQNQTSVEQYVIIIDDEIPTLNISSPLNGSISLVFVNFIDGTCNSTGSTIQSIAINDSRFQLIIDPTNLAEGAFRYVNLVDINGRNDLKITVTDDAGNIKEDTIWFYVDTVDPSVSINNPASDGDVTTNITITINGSANGTGTNIQSIESSLSTFVLDINPVGNPAGSYSFVNTTVIPDGQYTISINVTDEANRSSIIPRWFYVDRTSPLINITNPNSNGTIISDPLVWINGTVNATGSLVSSLTINDTANFAVQTAPIGLQEGNFAIWNISTLIDGTYSVEINATDAGGHLNSSIIIFIIKNQGVLSPSILLSIPGNDNEAISGATLTLNGTVFGNSSNIDLIWIDNINWSISVDPSGTLSGPFSFINSTNINDGQYMVNITVNNTDGLSASVVRSFWVDNTQPPTPAGLNRSVSGNSVLLMWLPVTDLTNVSYMVYRNGVNIKNTTWCNFTDANLPPGTYTYQIYAIDNAGNICSTAATITAVIGGAPPPFWIIIIIILIIGISSAAGIGTIVIVRRRSRAAAKSKKKQEQTSKLKAVKGPTLAETPKSHFIPDTFVSEQFVSEEMEEIAPPTALKPSMAPALVPTPPLVPAPAPEPTPVSTPDEALFNRINQDTVANLYLLVQGFKERLGSTDPSLITLDEWLEKLSGYPLTRLTASDSIRLARDIEFWEQGLL